jgi:hypothetical protein
VSTADEGRRWVHPVGAIAGQWRTVTGMSAWENTDVLHELMAREPLFHRTELGTTRAAFEAMTAEDFWEVGASGACYDREFVWSVLEKRYAEDAPDEWETSDLTCRPLGGRTHLLTYQLRQGSRITRRATIWERTADGWRVVYHQGTEVASAVLSPEVSTADRGEESS